MITPRNLTLVIGALLAAAALPLSQGFAAGSGNDFVHDLVRVTEKSELDSARSKAVVAACPSGHEVLSGGADVDSPRRGVGIRVSQAVAGGWKAEAYEVRPTDGDWAVQAFAICAKTNGDPSTGPQGPPGQRGPIGEPGRCLCFGDN